MIRKRIALILFGLTSILEGIVNTFLYLTFLDKYIPAADWALPLYINTIKIRHEDD